MQIVKIYANFEKSTELNVRFLGLSPHNFRTSSHFAMYLRCFQLDPINCTLLAIGHFLFPLKTSKGNFMHEKRRLSHSVSLFLAPSSVAQISLTLLISLSPSHSLSLSLSLSLSFNSLLCFFSLSLFSCTLFSLYCEFLLVRVLFCQYFLCLLSLDLTLSPVRLSVGSISLLRSTFSLSHLTSLLCSSGFSISRSHPLFCSLNLSRFLFPATSLSVS